MAENGSLTHPRYRQNRNSAAFREFELETKRRDADNARTAGPKNRAGPSVVYPLTDKRSAVETDGALPC